MNLALYIYLCEAIGNFLCVMGIAFGLSLFVLALLGFITLITNNFRSYYEVDKESRAIRNKFVKISVSILVISGIFSIITPSQKTMYAMAAAYYGEQAVKSEAFQRLNGKAMQLLEVKIDELIGEKKESK